LEVVGLRKRNSQADSDCSRSPRIRIASIRLCAVNVRSCFQV